MTTRQKEGSFNALLRATPSTFPQSTIPIPVVEPTPKTWSNPVEEEALMRAYYDIGPKRTSEDFLREYEALLAPIAPYLHEFVDVDVPLANGGADW